MYSLLKVLASAQVNVIWKALVWSVNFISCGSWSD